MPLTLEYLETFGVPVLGYQSDELAAFYSRTSGLKVDYNMKDAKEIADAITVKRSLGLNGGVIISNPIPEEYAMDPKVINSYIDNALIEMKKSGVKGKDCTPFLLKTIADATEGKSLASNIQLVFNNAIVGTAIATEICKNKEIR